MDHLLSGGGGGRTRKYYHLTEKGRRELKEKRAEWDRYTRAVSRVLEGASVLDDFFADYMDQAMEQVRWRRARPALAQELRTHLLDQRDACLAQGMSQTEAEAESLRQMGDPVEVGTQLDQVHRPAPPVGHAGPGWAAAVLRIFHQATVMQQLGRVQPYMPTVIVSILLGVAAMAAVYLGTIPCWDGVRSSSILWAWLLWLF